MFRSVQSRLLISTILVSVVAILSIGVVTMLLVNASFMKREEAYLRAQAAVLTPSIVKAINSGNLVELRRQVSMAGYMGQVRVQLFDRAGRLIVDSGQREGQSVFNPVGIDEQDLFIGAVLDDSGQVLRFSPLLSRQDDTAGQAVLSFIEPGQLLPSSSLFTAVSNVRYRTAVQIGPEIMGFLELSEGPAVGESIISSFWLALLGGGALALATAVFAGILAARQIHKPLRSLGDAAKSMGNEELSARAPRSKLVEFDRLARQFNMMADQLTDTIKRLENERAILRRTISDAGHEFRTPLTALKTFNTLLEDEVGDDDPAATLVHESERQISQLEQITTAMLELSRLEARLSGTNFELADLRIPVENAVQTLLPMSEDKNQQLYVVLPSDEVKYAFDPTAIQQAIGNLISNAIKYTPEGGDVEVRLKSGTDAVEIIVCDTGVGVPKEIQPYIFDRFYRSPEQKQGGSGLGLAICREIVDIHHGHVFLDPSLEEGSKFIIALPLPSSSVRRLEATKNTTSIGGGV